eukprot:TRINITY_DN3644_c0_g1_i1.p1 TRINITY_DN3644_c0_g1~~TRINITY_DN3644_c0_g1_i1.p1  ORF type:complete len:916 (-),score=176.77 TRINITY_DN3644_c0_g1_i1:102-2849(-)
MLSPGNLVLPAVKGGAKGPRPPSTPPPFAASKGAPGKGKDEGKSKGKGKGKEGSAGKGEGPTGWREVAQSQTVCKFGLACARDGCWFLHPQGRLIDLDPSKGLCRDGINCTMFNCFRVHPPGRMVSQPKECAMHIDEFSMPNRPDFAPTSKDREVFIDPLPSDDIKSAEMQDFVAAFGDVESIYQLPDQTHSRGYVLFKDHASALNCVKSGAGTWSESERGLTSDKRVIGYDIQSTYPESLVLLIAGEDGSKLNELQDKSGVRYLRLNAGGFNARKFGISERLHFTCKATEPQLAELKAGLDELINQAHEHLANLGPEAAQASAQEHYTLFIGSLPPEVSDSDLKTLCEGVGPVKEVRMGQDFKTGRTGGFAFVEFSNSGDAPAAVLRLKDHLFSGHRCRVDLAAPLMKRKPPGDPEANKTIFVGNIHPNVQEPHLWHLFGRVGPVADVRYKFEKGWDALSNTGTGIAFIDFLNPEDVHKAMEQLRDVTLLGLKIRLHLEERGGIQSITKVSCLSRVSPPRMKTENRKRDRSPAQQSRFPEKDERTVFVGNVPEDAGEADLRDIFERSGVVVDITRLIPKSVAFVEYQSPDEAANTVETLKGVTCLGQQLRLERKGEKRRRRSRSPKKRDERDDRIVFVGNIPDEAVEADLQAVFETAGEIVDLALLRSKNIAFIEYRTPHQAADAAETLRDAELYDKPLRVQRKNEREQQPKKKPKDDCKLFLGKVPDEATENDLRDIFEPAGPVESVKIIEGKGVAFIEYKSPEDATLALEMLKDVECLGQALRVNRYQQEDVAAKRRDREARSAAAFPPLPPPHSFPPMPPPGYYPPPPPGNFPPPPGAWPATPSPGPSAASHYMEVPGLSAGPKRPPAPSRPSVRPTTASHLQEPRHDSVDERPSKRGRRSSRLPPPTNMR